MSKSKTPSPIPSLVPKEIITKHRTVRMFVEFIFANKLPFLHTMSDNVKLKTSSCLKTTAKKSLEDAVNKVINLCKKGCFDVKCIDAELQFEYVEDSFSGAIVKICDVDD